MDTNLTKQVLNLPLPERLALVQEVWDSILSNPDAVPLTEAQRAELDRRVTHYEEDPGSARPWEEVRDQIWKR